MKTARFPQYCRSLLLRKRARERVLTFVLLIGLIGCVSLVIATCQSPSAEACPVLKTGKVDKSALREAEGVPEPAKCWMYQAMPKSGSSTVRSILTDWTTETNLTHARLTSDTLLSPEESRSIRNGNYAVVSGGFTEAVRAMGGGGECRWFTVFRHPIARLVSAFYYCKHKDPSDQICGNELIDLSTASLYDFARLWSNYGMREFIMSFVSPEDVMACPAVRAAAPEVPGWYKIGLFAEELYSNTTEAGGDLRPPSGLHDEAMEQFLRPAMGLLETYDAVGVLEDFENTMRLFNAALDMPGLDWSTEFQERGVINKGVDAIKVEQEETLRSAWTDPVLHRFIWLDLSLYDHAVDIHHKQLIRFGLG